MNEMTSPLLPLLLVAAVAAPSEGPAIPIACRVSALDKAQRKRQQELLRLVRASAQATQDLSDGYAFRLAADPALFRQAAEWVTLERRCCPFLEFGLEWRKDDTVWIRLTGGPGVKDFLAAEILGGEAPPPPVR
jgi:hypothetical protein